MTQMFALVDKVVMLLCIFGRCGSEGVWDRSPTLLHTTGWGHVLWPAYPSWTRCLQFPETHVRIHVIGALGQPIVQGALERA
ncbi:hypothetical protein EDD15DRAFT_2285016 [Pisolithus albus]|nr:hypothetical protein EDD15DRAFT_2302793 [Pisolithus albus]KAI5985395.1 hypothetical protein EDD15DRAFT_2302855 [Pisolithus albus]KAI5989344.1 hypothetical protein EDD15DRAFT_2285016 [Pisolithus albus]